MKTILSLSLFMMLCLGISCDIENHKVWKAENEKDVSKIWQLSDVLVSRHEHESKDNLLNASMNNALLEQGFMLCLFPDGKASELINNNFQASEWRLISENNKIELSHSNSKDTLVIVDLIKKKEIDYLIVEYKKIGKIELQQHSGMLSDYKEDPFYPSNNEWRKKPNNVESELEIKKRIQNYVRHITLILKATMERESQIVSFANSKGIIKIYNGGIGIVNTNEIPEEWKAGFYNEEQAMWGYEVYRNYLRITQYNGASPGNWVKGDYNILLSLYKKIDEDINGHELNEKYK